MLAKSRNLLHSLPLSLMPFFGFYVPADNPVTNGDIIDKFLADQKALYGGRNAE